MSGRSFGLADAEAFRLTARVFVDQAGRMEPGIAGGPSFGLMKEAADGRAFADARGQHEAVCAFLDCLKRASQQGPTPETFTFVAKCAEYDRYLDEKVVEFRANPRGDWSAAAVKSEDNAVIAQVVDEIAAQLRSF